MITAENEMNTEKIATRSNKPAVEESIHLYHVKHR
ncbi:hypothetical protein PARMER_01706 [Parabacteroides merdae ATCC 43184]|nr:hypothetical protein PARMER_01706 [Parabacteroides merdae ATCC 43184]